MRRSSAAVVLVLRESSGVPHLLAVTNRAFGGISLPGGKIDGEEDPKLAAVRELREETSLIVKRESLTRIAEGLNIVDDTIMSVHVYLASLVCGEPLDVEEGTRHQWVTFETLLQSSPFRGFYARRFPDGVSHFRPTTFEQRA